MGAAGGSSWAQSYLLWLPRGGGVSSGSRGRLRAAPDHDCHWTPAPVLQARLQRCSDAGCAVPGGCGAHLLRKHASGGHPAFSAHSRPPPHPLGPAAPAPQPPGAGRGVLGKKNSGSPPASTRVTACLIRSNQLAPFCPGLRVCPLGPRQREPGLRGGDRPCSISRPPPPSRPTS